MVEIYKLVSEYRADVFHEQSGETINYSAQVFEGHQPGRFSIRHSHTLMGKEGSGFWASDSYTSANSPEEAETLVRGWAGMLASAFEVKPWR
jgi:hypothetical protein